MRKCESAVYKIKAKVTFTVYTSTCVTVAHCDVTVSRPHSYKLKWQNSTVMATVARF